MVGERVMLVLWVMMVGDNGDRDNGGWGNGHVGVVGNGGWGNGGVDGVYNGGVSGRGNGSVGLWRYWWCFVVEVMLVLVLKVMLLLMVG